MGIRQSSEANQRTPDYFHHLVLPLKLVACWEWFERPKKDYQIIVNNVYLIMTLFLLLNMLVSLATHIYLVWQGVMFSLDILSEVLPLVFSLFIISYFYVYKYDLYDLVEYINKNFQWHSASGVTNMTMQKSYDLANRFAYFYTACVMFSVTMYIIVPIADHLTRNASLPWVYEDMDHIFFVFLIRLCLVQAIIGLAIGQLGVFFVTTSMVLCGQLDLLCCSLRNVRYTGLIRSGIQHKALLNRFEGILADEEHCFSYNETNVETPQYHFDRMNKTDDNISSYDIYDPTFDDSTCSAMEDCARLHQVIKEFKIRFEKFVSPLLVVRVVHCNVYLCTLLYTATVKFDLAVFEYLFAVVLDIFFYCYFGNQIIIQIKVTYHYEGDAANRVSEAAYESAWITMGVRPRRMLLNILLSSRRSLIVRAGNFLAIDLQTFIRILKTSFSYYTLLVNVNEKKK